MFKFIALSAATLSLAVPAYAESAQTTQPIEAVSLHDGALDMVAYFTENDDGEYVVVATFAEGDGAYPKRITLALDDGDNVQFAILGHKDSLYGFARNGDVLAVKVDQVLATTQAAGLTPDAT
ncbi:hypothetical protein [Amaricoccus macauensis]|uniref:hypothetical protein n=1 Tax=Amaricoccus macauensis TaxID=57001 RepID=UPI003C799B9C